MREVQAALVRLYEAGQFAEALKFLEQEQSRYPEEMMRFYYWRVCLTAQLKRVDQALQLMEEAIGKGLCFSTAMLREDPDLAILQKHPTFEHLVAVCQERQSQAMVNARPSCTVLKPEPDGRSNPMLMVLHGNTGNGQTDTEKWRPAVKRGWIVALMQSSQPWGANSFVWHDLDWAVRDVQMLYRQLVQQYDLDLNRIVVGGFSRGAEIAIWLGLTRTLSTRGVIAIAPGGSFTAHPAQWQPILEASAEAHAICCYLATGKQDQGYSGTQQFVDLLTRYHVRYRFDVHALGHDFPADFDRRLEDILEFVVQCPS